MLYQFKQLEHNGLKGTIGEQLARRFIRHILTPKIVKEEGWSHVVYSRNDYKQHKKHTLLWTRKLFTFDEFREDFLLHGFYATQQLLTKYAQVVAVLIQNHCTPDGLLIKLKETGRKKKIDERTTRFLETRGLNCDEQRNTHVPIVNGELEIIEVKSGRNPNLMDKQRQTYSDLIINGCPLRLIRVRIVSFDRNQFLVEESKFTNPL
ncbi:MAG: hypothetical protein JSV35_06870 [Candidatus Bathyarchaeota archaeon]|nr:MAG: hypothetical protein JSV35_06870 [Candidatus Bathyarchaeota archaeon]